jgi:hypothetical protein
MACKGSGFKSLSSTQQRRLASCQSKVRRTCGPCRSKPSRPARLAAQPVGARSFQIDQLGQGQSPVARRPISCPLHDEIRNDPGTVTRDHGLGGERLTRGGETWNRALFSNTEAHRCRLSCAGAGWSWSLVAC